MDRDAIKARALLLEEKSRWHVCAFRHKSLIVSFHLDFFIQFQILHGLRVIHLYISQYVR